MAAGEMTSDSRTNRYSSSDVKKTSSVIQKGPAFFDRTCVAIASSVVVWSGTRHLAHTRANEFRPVRYLHHVIEHELVGGATLDLGRRGDKGETGKMVHPW